MKKKENRDWVIISSSLIIGFFLFIIVCYFATMPETDLTLGDKLFTSQTQNNNSRFEIVESSSSVSKEGTFTITGKVKQKEEKNFQGLFITFTMYDKNKVKVRSTTACLSNYLGNGLWEFSAIGNDADKIVTSYKLENIYGY